LGLDDARKMVEAGATRIGASVGVKIAQEAAGVRTNGGAAFQY
jgi:deoxyribose-phosphate aldolase